MAHAGVHVLFGIKGLVTLSCRAVTGMSCISPIAPVRETACGLKLDSTLMTARTRLGSTLWRAAACSIAVLMSAGGATSPAAEDFGAGAVFSMLRTSAAAERAARME